MVDGGWRAELERAFARERAGRWEEAVQIFRDLFRAAARGRDPDALVETLYGQARVLPRLESGEAAAEMAELCLEIARRHGFPRMVARTLNLMALAHFSRGEHTPAQELYSQALDQARDAGDDALIGFICQNLGVLANIRGDLREARLLYLESIGASVRSGEKVSALMVYNNLGMVCSDLGEYLEAELYFSRGIEIAERIGDTAQLGRLYVNRAEPLIRTGELARARDSLDRAAAIASLIQTQPTLADESRFRGIIAREEGDHDEAEHQLQRSLRIASDAGLQLMRAEALEELARLRWAEERTAEAHALADEAESAFVELRAERDASRVRALREGWHETRTAKGLAIPRDVG